MPGHRDRAGGAGRAAAIRRSKAWSIGSNLQLFCTPAINLFEKPRIDRIHVNDSSYEFHVVADRTRPLDFEIYQVTEVVGHGAGDDSEQRFLPFYSASSTDAEHSQSAYFTTRREPRLVSAGAEAARFAVELHRQRSVPVAGRFDAGALLRRPAAALDPGALHQSRSGAADADRPGPDRLLAEHRGAGDQRAGDERSEPSVRRSRGRRDRVARDQPPVAQLPVAGECDRPAGRGRAARSARALRDHGGRQRAAADRRDSRRCSVGRVVRRLPGRGPIAFGRGLEITVDVDEMGFEGGSAFLLGAVLDRYFARYVSINSVTETVLRSQSRGEINRWAPNWGTRPTL